MYKELLWFFFPKGIGLLEFTIYRATNLRISVGSRFYRWI